jgi:hypothetical protein
MNDISRIGNFNVYTDPSWRRKDTNVFVPPFSSDSGGIGTDEVISVYFDISDANKDGMSADFLENYNNVAPLFYSSDTDAMRLYTPDNVSSLDVYNSDGIRALGLMRLNDELTEMILINAGDTITINELSSNIISNNIFFELWFNEDMFAYNGRGFRMLMDPVESLQNTGYHWYLGQYQLISSYDDNFEIQCIIPQNKIYFRRD